VRKQAVAHGVVEPVVGVPQHGGDIVCGRRHARSLVVDEAGYTARDHDVLGLEIAVDNGFGEGVGLTGEALEVVVERFGRGRMPAAHALDEAFKKVAGLPAEVVIVEEPAGEKPALIDVGRGVDVEGDETVQDAPVHVFCFFGGTREAEIVIEGEVAEVFEFGSPGRGVEKEQLRHGDVVSSEEPRIGDVPVVVRFVGRTHHTDDRSLAIPGTVVAPPRAANANWNPVLGDGEAEELGFSECDAEAIAHDAVLVPDAGRDVRPREDDTVAQGGAVVEHGAFLDDDVAIEVHVPSADAGGGVKQFSVTAQGVNDRGCIGGGSTDVVPETARKVDTADAPARRDGGQPGVHRVGCAVGQVGEKLGVIHCDAGEGEDARCARGHRAAAHAHNAASTVNSDLVERGTVVEGQCNDVVGCLVCLEEGAEVDIRQDVRIMNNERAVFQERLRVLESAAGAEQ